MMNSVVDNRGEALTIGDLVRVERISAHRFREATGVSDLSPLKLVGFLQHECVPTTLILIVLDPCTGTQVCVFKDMVRKCPLDRTPSSHSFKNMLKHL
jgi:hypothetical protein